MDPHDHTVRSGTPDNPTDLFNSDNLSEDETYSFTFADAGSYNYFCEIHGADMTGVVNVEDN